MNSLKKPLIINSRYLYCILLIGICISCSFGSSQNNQTSANKSEGLIFEKNNNDLNIEDFENFFIEFCYNEDFQKSRVEFPLFFAALNFDLTDTDTLYLEKDEWRYSNLGFSAIFLYIYHFYDNFDREFNDTNERVFSIRGLNTGEISHYYFKRNGGLWYLVKVEDFST